MLKRNILLWNLNTSINMLCLCQRLPQFHLRHSHAVLGLVFTTANRKKKSHGQISFFIWWLKEKKRKKQRNKKNNWMNYCKLWQVFGLLKFQKCLHVSPVNVLIQNQAKKEQSKGNNIQTAINTFKCCVNGACCLADQRGANWSDSVIEIAASNRSFKSSAETSSSLISHLSVIWPQTGVRYSSRRWKRQDGKNKVN